MKRARFLRHRKPPTPRAERPGQPPPLRGPQCRGCGARVRWITTKAGKPMICDPEKITAWVTDTAATLSAAKVVLMTEDGKMERGKQASPIMEGSREIEGYVPHWSTCPKAKEFQKGGALR